eukprot:2895044-Amphidinium_carterae.1
MKELSVKHPPPLPPPSSRGEFLLMHLHDGSVVVVVGLTNDQAIDPLALVPLRQLIAFVRWVTCPQFLGCVDGSGHVKRTVFCGG